MSVLVTGGTGALGFHILSMMTRNGEKLYSFSDEQPQPWQKISDVLYRSGNLLDFKEVLSVVKEAHPRAIFHLASQSSVGLSFKKPYETLSTNLLGTQNLLEAARQAAPEAKILLLSSSEVYGRTSGTLLTTLHKETDLPNPLTPYATSKACMELLGNQFTNAYGMHIVTIRPFHFTGPHHSRRFLLPSIASQLVKIKKYGAEPILYAGSLEVSRDVSDVRDVARGLIQVLQAGTPGEVYNICSGNSYTFRELTEMLVEIADADVDFRFDPSKERLFDIPLLVGDPAKIMDLGWKPMITMEDCLEDLYNEMTVRLKMEREMK